MRQHANLAFSNLLYLLGLSLVVLIPASGMGVVVISFTVRRLGWTFAADLLLLYVAFAFSSTADPRWLLATPIVVAVLLLGAADVAWASW